MIGMDVHGRGWFMDLSKKCNLEPISLHVPTAVKVQAVGCELKDCVPVFERLRFRIRPPSTLQTWPLSKTMSCGP